MTEQLTHTQWVHELLAYQLGSKISKKKQKNIQTKNLSLKTKSLHQKKPKNKKQKNKQKKKLTLSLLSPASIKVNHYPFLSFFFSEAISVFCS